LSSSVAIVAGDLPVEQDVLNLGTLTDVVFG
jgi:hypothetical protein